MDNGTNFAGGERELRESVASIKTALRVILKDQTVPDPVLLTTLVEVEGIMNAKPLGYLSPDVSDPTPVTPVADTAQHQ